MKLLLGCGDEIRGTGWVHHDRRMHSPHVQVAHDLEWLPWPWSDEVFEEIVALDVLEHLPNTVRFMDECWRVLVPNGSLTVRVPNWTSENAWRDPTHYRVFHPDTFSYFDPLMPWGERFGQFYTRRYWRLVELEAADNITAVLLKRRQEETWERSGKP